ncbi:DUF4390 domain-containing protein [Candidatus Halobeggiatoa sp. HSG11]|nr:DUF4390 domain-containing protein [Candidatus Halobeggiatoa sp. HSG11]
MSKLLNKLGIIILVFLLHSPCFAEFSIDYAETSLIDGVYVLDAELNFNLTEVAIDALQNGVSLPLVLTVVVKRNRWYLWNKKITTIKKAYELKYYALSRQYSLKNLATNNKENFPNLYAAIDYLGKIEKLPLLKQYVLTDSIDKYWVYLQIHLDIESLPVPLRPIAHLSSQWRLSSSWYSCHLQP